MRIFKTGIDVRCSSFKEQNESYVVSQGWPVSGDVSCMFKEQDNFSRFFDDVKNDCIKAYKTISERSLRNAFRNLLLNIHSGDVILAFEGNTCKGIAEVPPNYVYYYDTNFDNYNNCLFPINWVNWSEFCQKFDDQGGEGVPGIVNCGLTRFNIYIKENWESYKQKTNYDPQMSENQEVNNKLQILTQQLNQRKMESQERFLNDKKIQEYVALLKTNKNIIFNGAPGTGKTYLAKQIAESLIRETAEKPIEILKRKVAEFDVASNPDLQKIREEDKRLRDTFLRQFPVDKLKSLSLEDYCIGTGGKYNFCWWMEVGSRPLGRFYARKSATYKVYYDKEKEKHVCSDSVGVEENVSSIPAEIMHRVADSLFDCVSNKKLDSFLPVSFILKILSVYYPDEFFPINSSNHLENVMTLFNISSQSNDVSSKNLAVYEFYKREIGEKNITPYEFSRLLYNNFNIGSKNPVSTSMGSDLIGNQEFVQFHPSYDYTDFVEGLRPVKDERGNIGFELKDGTFKQFCLNALNDPNRNYVFIIDEINRGEISKIFGELFFSIDPDYRGTTGKVRTQYANLQETANDFDEHLNEDEYGYFYVPENVYVIGTMNDIDRSVESMDFAFRRRFRFVELMAKENAGMLAALGSPLREKAVNRMNNLNAAIEGIDGLGPSYHIGASYFLKLKDCGNDFNKLWDNYLSGLLREYLRGFIDINGKINTLKAAFDNESAQNNGQPEEC